VPVYVVPGNHDIENPAAHAYEGDRSIAVESMTAPGFVQVYGDFGYDEAKLRDRDSLSYVAEPVEGLWIVGIDSGRHGRIRPETIHWLRHVLGLAATEGKAVIGFVHHGVLEHFQGQRQYATDFLLKDHERVALFLAGQGMRIVFTGHMHAQDVVRKRWSVGGGPVSLVDVETGSLSSFPCAFRIVEIVDQPSNTIRIRTGYIASIRGRRTGFSSYAYRKSFGATRRAVKSRLKSMWVSDAHAAAMADWLALSALAHFMGDERPEQNPLDPEGLGFWARFLARAARELFNGLWHDPEPPDNDLVLSLD
jgi:3',5'-cyclic AMP phosphodiesterase CpdA